jgi:long-chain acyl-CoA synthetase
MSRYEWLRESGPAKPADGDKPSRSACYRHKKHASAPVSSTATTLFEVFENSVKTCHDRPCLGHRPVNKDGEAGDFTFLTYKETSDKVKGFAASLKAAGVNKKDRVAVFGANCSEWMIAMQVR